VELGEEEGSATHTVHRAPVLLATKDENPQLALSATLDISVGNIAINRRRRMPIITASVALMIYTHIIAWFELWRGRRVSRRMAQCRARLYEL